METQKPAQRLCSEIQLFDLCELEFCKEKNGRFCTNAEALERFEAIQEEDERTSARFVSGEIDEDDEDELEGFGIDEFDEDEDM